jgi:hypothetical protein
VHTRPLCALRSCTAAPCSPLPSRHCVRAAVGGYGRLRAPGASTCPFGACGGNVPKFTHPLSTLCCCSCALLRPCHIRHVPFEDSCTVHPYLSWAGGFALSSCRWARGRGGVCVGAQLEGRVWKSRGFGGRSCAFCPHEYFAITYGCSYGCARFAHGSRQGAHHDGMPGNVTREPPH